MRNYECFEVLQKLERNVHYQNAIMEREIQSWDQMKGTKSYRQGRQEYFGSNANYPAMSSRREPIPQASHRAAKRSVPNLHLSQIKTGGGMSVRSNQVLPTQFYEANMDDSSIIYNEEPSALDLPLEDPDEADDVFQSLGGRNGYQQRMANFHQQSKTMRHERKYIQKMNSDRNANDIDQRKRAKYDKNIEFNDYQKSLREGVTPQSPDRGTHTIRSTRPKDKHKLKQIQEELSSDDSGAVNRKNVGNNQRVYRNVEPQIVSETDDYDMRNHRPQPGDISQRNQSIFKLSIRDDSKMLDQHHSSRFFENQQNLSSARRRGKSAVSARTQIGDSEGPSRFLQRHVASRFLRQDDDGTGDMITSTTDEEALRRLNSKSNTNKRPISSPSLGDPWKVSRSRDRSTRSAVTARDDMSDTQQPSYAEIAYDKTTAIVQSVKGLLATGISKIKTLIGKQPPTVSISRTSKSRKRGRQLSSSEDSYERYKTPNNGRSQSRKAQQQEPMETSEGEVGERKSRHVNFNINRVVSPQPEEVRAKSAVSQRQAQSNKKTIQIQADSQPIKSVLKNSAREPSQMSAKSVGVGSHNINSSVNHQATSSNQEQLLSAPPLPMMQSIQSSVPSDKQQHRAVDQPKSIATNNLKPKQIFLRKNYQSSEERVGKSQRVNTNEDQWQQLSDSSRQSSQQRQRIVQEINQRQQQLIKQLTADSSVQSNVKTNSNGQHSVAKSNAYLATAISTNQKSNNNGIIGSLNGGSQKGKPQLSQEQFELIMSEQEETVKKNLMGKQLQMKQQASPVIKPPELPKPLSIAEQNNVDIQRFYEDLLDNTNSVSIQVATNLPVKIAGQAPPTAAPIIEKDTLDESNLSNLYNRIMSDHQEIIAPRQQTAQVPPEEKVEVSLVESEFNPPTQNIGTSVLFKQQDLTFQSGMTDLRKALQEEEEVLDNISNCSFIDEDGAKKINQQIIQSNILDKGQFLGSQNNSLHHSISSAANRQQSVGARPTGMQILRNQNNSMHFNTFGNSFACQGRYQSDNEDNNLPIQNPTSNILRKQQHETPQKIGLPAAPKSANHNNITNNQSMQFTQQEIQPQAVAPQPGSGNAGQGSAQSDNTSSSAAVVIHSQNSHATQKLSQPDPHQQMINLFKEDQELQFQSSPQTIKLPLPTNRQPADDTQTDLETGFNPKKQAKNTEDEWATQHNDDQQLNTFQGLSSISEHKFQEQQQLRCGADNSTEQEIKKSTIMRKLIEIMDESHINDDQTPSQSSVTNKPSEQSQSIQQQPVLLADEEEEADLLSDRPKKQKIEMIDKKGGDSHQPRSTATHRANSSTRRGNTRYGGGEHDAIDDSMIQFDLTQSKIIENENEDKRRQQYMEESKQQRKSLKLQIQEQIQSIVVSEENQQMPKNTQGAKELKTELEAVVMPLIILKAAVDGPLEVRETHLMDVSAEEEGEATSIPKKVDRKYLAANKEDDSISRIYNELETVQEESISQVKVMPVVPQITTSVVKAFEPIPEDEVKLPSLATLSGRKDSLPPLIRYQSEDDERKPVHELFYPKEQQSTRRSVSGNLPTQEDNQAVILPGSTLQWNRDDKQNRSTATPLFNYATSSEDEGNTNRKSQSRDRQQKMAKLLSKYQLESVANKEIPLPQPLHQSPIAHQPSLSQQRTIRDVSFKSHNISTHTDTSERLKENLKLFSKNRLLQKANNQQAKKDEIPKSNISAAKQQ